MSKSTKSKAELKKLQRNTKRNLRRMAKDSHPHYLLTAGRIFKYGLYSFGRNIWLSIAATLVMVITLLILFSTALASIVLSQAADAMREKIDITISLQSSTPTETLKSMSDTLRQDPNVKTVIISTAEEGYERSLQENADNEELMSVLQDDDMKTIMLNTMPATLRVRVFDVDNLSSIQNIVEHNEQFIEFIHPEIPPTYDVNRTEIETITSWANIAKNGGLILGAVFLTISTLVIFNTIRMSIFSRREEIYMMKLVGADGSFIRGPFIVEAGLCGIISGIIAASLSLLGFNLIEPGLTDYGINLTTMTNLLHSSWLVFLYAIMVILGVIIGATSARLAIQKYLDS